MGGIIESFIAAEVAPLAQRIEGLEGRVLAVEKFSATMRGEMNERAASLVAAMSAEAEAVDGQIAQIRQEAGKVADLSAVVDKLGLQIDGTSALAEDVRRRLVAHIEAYTSTLERAHAETVEPAGPQASPPARRRSVTVAQVKAPTTGKATCPTCAAKNVETRKRGRMTVCTSCSPTH